MKQTNIRCVDCVESIVICNSVHYATVEIALAKRINTPDVRDSLACQIPRDEDEHRIASCLRLGHKIELLR